MIVHSKTRHMTPSKFISSAWELDFVISSADVAKLHVDFISNLIALARADDIDVHRIDFSKYNGAYAAMKAEDSALFGAAVSTEPKNKTLLLFDNCDCLSALNIDLTFYLREVLTTRFSGKTQSIFVARKKSLELLFCDSNAAFYQSNFSITS